MKLPLYLIPHLLFKPALVVSAVAERSKLYFIVAYFVLLLLIAVLVSYFLQIPLYGLPASESAFKSFGFLYRLYPWNALLSIPVFTLFYYFYPSNRKNSFFADMCLALLTSIQGLFIFILFVIGFKVSGLSFEAFEWNYFLMYGCICLFQVFLFYKALQPDISFWSVPVILLMNVLMNFFAISISKALIGLLFKDLIPPGSEGIL